MAEGTTVVSAEDQAKAASTYKNSQMLKYAFIAVIVILVVWFAYKSFIK